MTYFKLLLKKSKFLYITDSARRIYAAMIFKLDQSVDEVVEALNNRKMLENSIILFISDNGALTEDILQNHGNNYSLHGIKNSPWEGGVRGVAAIRSPLIKKCKRVSNQLISIVDWLPTLLSAIGISLGSWHLAGMSPEGKSDDRFIPAIRSSHVHHFWCAKIMYHIIITFSLIYVYYIRFKNSRKQRIYKMNTSSMELKIERDQQSAKSKYLN